MPTNSQLYNRAMEAITDLLFDTSVSHRVAVNNLQSLKDEIDCLIDARDPEDDGDV